MKQASKAASIVILLFELSLLSLIALGLWLLSLAGFSQGIVISGLIGGLIFILPSAYFAHYAFRHRSAMANLGESWGANSDSGLPGSEKPEVRKVELAELAKVTRSFYQGEIGKFVLTVMSFAVVFRFYPTIDAISLFSVFGIMTVTHWWIANVVTQRLYETPRTT